MDNQDQYIPEHLAEKWQSVSRELGEASMQLVEANNRYHEAILARLAINRELKNWQMSEYFGL
jgi:hypothetical protein